LIRKAITKTHFEIGSEPAATPPKGNSRTHYQDLVRERRQPGSPKHQEVLQRVVQKAALKLNDEQMVGRTGEAEDRCGTASTEAI
jgi:hypothetical protein